MLNFSRNVFSLLFLLLLSSISFCQDLATVIEESEKSVVRIEVKGIEGDGLGSGFVVTSDGMIVTNVHVLAGADKARAIFPNGQVYEIVGTHHIDEARDICVAKLRSASTEPIKLASDLPRKGETVTALGAPLGLSFTATNGIVSAIRKNFGKDVGDNQAKGTWVQVDAALSPGNSGGPLINKTGEVVAMSTRASFGGRAQNLNFGISIADIKNAFRNAKSAPLKSLVDGIQKVKMHDIAGGGDEEPGSRIKRKSIPESAIRNYVDSGRANFKELSRDFRRDLTAASRQLSAFKKGQVGFPLGINSTAPIMVRMVRGVERFHFRSDSIKRKLVSRQQKTVDKLKKIKTAIEKDSPELALMELLKRAGPAIDVTEKSTVGFVREAIVIHPFNDHEIAVDIDGAPCLMWVESTSGLAREEKLPPTIAFVAGTETMMIPGKSTMAVTIIQEVTDREFDEVAAFSTWRAGKHSVEAKLLGFAGEKVRLEKRDGNVIEVPLSVLDADSQKRAKPAKR